MRQFLALELSEALRDEIRALQQELRAELPGWRWVRPQAIYLTLRFLGEVSADLDRRARAVWREAAASASQLTLRFEGLGSFPPRGRPRVLWVGVHEQGSEGRLAHLAGALERGAREVGLEPDNRPFRAHLTLARAQRGSRATFPDAHDFASGTVQQIDDVVLFRSELLPTGARYSILDRFPLRRA